MPSKLYFEAKAFITAYELAFGVPDKEFTEYWTLKKRLQKLGSIKKHSPVKANIKTRKQQAEATLYQRIKFLQALNASNALKVFVRDDGSYLMQDFEFKNKNLVVYAQVVTAFGENGNILRIVIRYNGSSITKTEIESLTKMFRRNA